MKANVRFLNSVLASNPMKDNRKNIKNYNDQPTYKKGHFGEEIVRKILVASGYKVVHNPENKLIPDFTVSSASDKFCAEVKCNSVWEYTPHKIPVYTIEKVEIDAYTEWALERKMHCFLFIIDEKKSEIFFNSLINLMKNRYVKGYEFPNYFTEKERQIEKVALSADLFKEFAPLSAKDIAGLKSFNQAIYRQKWEAKNFEEEFEF